MNATTSTPASPPPSARGLEELILIAGKDDYPLLLARSAREQGVKRLVAIAFRGETKRAIAQYADEVRWLYLGQMKPFLDALTQSGIKNAVMAGQITPGNLFNVRFDREAWALLSGLKERNAHTIFGAIGDRIRSLGIELLPAYLFMESFMPAPGPIATRLPTEQEQADVQLGLRVAKTASAVEIGQTVVVKGGTVLAVEAFEGTDATIQRAGRLGGRGIVVVKVAKQGHDMRFDIPVIGERTLKTLRKARAAVLAVEARRTILLDRQRLAAQADAMGLCLLAVEARQEGTQTP